MASSSSGVSPLVPMAPTTSPSTVSGIPPVSADAPCSASAPRRPPVTCSSISRLGRTKIAAVRALSTATRELAIWAPGVRRSSTTSPHGSTTVITTRRSCAIAWRAAAAITLSAPASSMILRVRTMDMGSGSLEGDGPDRVVGGDQQAVAGEGEVDGARKVDLAQQGAGGGEDEQAGSARRVDVAAPVGLQAVRGAGLDRREGAAVGEQAAVQDV